MKSAFEEKDYMTDQMSKKRRSNSQKYLSDEKEGTPKSSQIDDSTMCWGKPGQKIQVKKHWLVC